MNLARHEALIPQLHGGSDPGHALDHAGQGRVQDRSLLGRGHFIKPEITSEILEENISNDNGLCD